MKRRELEIIHRNGRFLVLSASEALPFSLTQAARDTAYRVDGLCKRLGVSERHLRRVFEEGLGISPKEWLRNERMVAARAFLRAGAPVKGAAADLGFTNHRVFSREFLAFYGVSPTAVQRREYNRRLENAVF